MDDNRAERADVPRTNWSNNLRFSTDRVFAPTNLDEVRAVVKANAKLKGLGSRHSFNDVADSQFAQISMRGMRSIEIDAAARTVTVGAGTAYGELAPVLDQAGFALGNLASLPHISVGGTIATATHGSGVGNQNLSAQVSALEIVVADGNVVRLSRNRDGEMFKTAVVHLGGLGVVTAVTLDLQPRFEMTQTVYENLSFDQLEDHLEAILGAAYSVSLFTTWQDNCATQVWLKSRLEPGMTPPVYEALPKEFYGATLQTAKLHPLRGMPAQNCTDQMGSLGPWYARLPHFKMEFTPSSGEELQSEYFVARERGYEAIRALELLREEITPHLIVAEIRTVSADDLPMSMAYQQNSMAFHFTWKPDEAAVQKVLLALEATLASFGARPHWGKIFQIKARTLEERYPRLADYRALAGKMDPGGKFRNAFLERSVFGSQQ